MPPWVFLYLYKTRDKAVENTAKFISPLLTREGKYYKKEKNTAKDAENAKSKMQTLSEAVLRTNTWRDEFNMNF